MAPNPSGRGTSDGVEYSRPLDQAPVFYSNQAMIATTDFDIKVIHCQIENVIEGAVKTTNPQVVVYMSHEHAKKVANVLLEQIKRYEEAKAATKAK